MRKAALAILFLSACASGNTIDKTARPDIDLLQLYAPGDMGWGRGVGQIEAEFGFRIRNRATFPITLRRIELSSVGSGGYHLRREDRGFTSEIPAGHAAALKMNARAYFTTDITGRPSQEPVTLRAVVYFDSPEGPFREIVTRQVEQFSRGPR